MIKNNLSSQGNMKLFGILTTFAFALGLAGIVYYTQTTNVNPHSQAAESAIVSIPIANNSFEKFTQTNVLCLPNWTLSTRVASVNPGCINAVFTISNEHHSGKFGLQFNPPGDIWTSTDTTDRLKNVPLEIAPGTYQISLWLKSNSGINKKSYVALWIASKAESIGHTPLTNTNNLWKEIKSGLIKITEKSTCSIWIAGYPGSSFIIDDVKLEKIQ